MELGKAYVQVIPSTRGVSSQLTTQLKGATASAGERSGGGFAQGFGKTAVKAIGAMGVATSIGAVFSKGFSRMTAIDNAKAKLSALGHDLESVQKISENANAAVKGTAYGMDAAMTAAASATAAGIKPGQELTRYLSLMGDAASVAGVSMDEMGSIFNKVAANGKVTTEEMNQLADRGIPIWQLLAKETGMSMDELRDAISSGKVGIEEFQNAIETGMGGAAKEIGSKTITGAISNINASISRMGANLLGSADDANSFAGKLLPLMNNVMGFMGKIEAGASVLGQVISSILGPIMDGLGQVFTEVSKGTGTLEPLKDILLQIGNFLGEVVAAVMPIIIQAIKNAFQILGPLITQLKAVFTALSPLFTIVKKVVSVVVSATSRVMSVVTKAVKAIITRLGFAGVVGKVRGVFNKVREAIADPIDAAKEKVRGIIDKIKGIFPLNVGKILNIKIPHISVSGGKAPWGIAGKGTPPSFSVSWNAKAMDNPYLFNNATLFGAGEAGDEVLYGRNNLMRDIANAVKSTNGAGDVVVNLNYDASDDAMDMLRDLVRGVQRYRMAGVI